MTCGILVPGPGIEPVPPALGARNPKHCTTGEVPEFIHFQGDMCLPVTCGLMQSQMIREMDRFLLTKPQNSYVCVFKYVHVH